MTTPKEHKYTISTKIGPLDVVGRACGRQDSLAVRRVDLLMGVEYVVDHVHSGRRVAGFTGTAGNDAMIERIARLFGTELDGMIGGLLREKDHNDLREAMPRMVKDWIVHCDDYGYVSFCEFDGDSESLGGE